MDDYQILIAELQNVQQHMDEARKDIVAAKLRSKQLIEQSSACKEKIGVVKQQVTVLARYVDDDKVHVSSRQQTEKAIALKLALSTEKKELQQTLVNHCKQYIQWKESEGQGLLQKKMELKRHEIGACKSQVIEVELEISQRVAKLEACRRDVSGQQNALAEKLKEKQQVEQLASEHQRRVASNLQRNQKAAQMMKVAREEIDQFQMFCESLTVSIERDNKAAAQLQQTNAALTLRVQAKQQQRDATARRAPPSRTGPPVNVPRAPPVQHMAPASPMQRMTLSVEPVGSSPRQSQPRAPAVEKVIIPRLPVSPQQQYTFQQKQDIDIDMQAQTEESPPTKPRQRKARKVIQEDERIYPSLSSSSDDDEFLFEPPAWRK